MDEAVITWKQARAAMTPDEIARADAYPCWSVARDVIGRMTHFDMEKYELVALPNLRAWRLVRRGPPAHAGEGVMTG